MTRNLNNLKFSNFLRESKSSLHLFVTNNPKKFYIDLEVAPYRSN